MPVLTPTVPKAKMIQTLLELDSHLTKTESIILCGNASRLFRGENPCTKAPAIEFCQMPSNSVLTAMNIVDKDCTLFNRTSYCLVGLLVDFEDRLQPVDIGTNHLVISVIHRLDWIVSKLTYETLEEVIKNKVVTREDLIWVKRKLHLYGGVNEIEAIRCLVTLFHQYGISDWW